MESSLASATWPDLTEGTYAAAVERVVASGELTEHREVALLEAEFGDYLGADYSAVAAVSSGTAAVEACLRVLGVDKDWDVFVPAMTFAGSALGVLNIGANLRFVDVRPGTWNIDPDAVGAALGSRQAAVVAVDLHGLPANYYSLERLDVRLVEDACQAYGASQDGREAGRLASAAAFSLNKTKTLFAGEGGLCVFRDPEYAQVVRLMRRFGEPWCAVPSQRWAHGADYCAGFGANWKLPELSAAIARASLRELDGHVQRAASAAAVLHVACQQSDLLVPPLVPPGSTHAWHKFRVVPGDVDRDRVMRALASAGVPVCLWQTRPLPDHPLFADCQADPYPEARRALAETFIIGNEDRPLASLRNSEVEDWAEKIANLRSYL